MATFPHMENSNGGVVVVLDGNTVTMRGTANGIGRPFLNVSGSGNSLFDFFNPCDVVNIALQPVKGDVEKVSFAVKYIDADGEIQWSGKLPFTLTNDISDCYLRIFGYDSINCQEGINYDIEFNIMLYSGTEKKEYEPYTGGIPSPSPDYPQDLVSVGDGGSVGVSVSDGAEDNVQLLTISTPNGLPGIQVTDASLANYTDGDGNMWCCDEVDLERGVYVQRIHMEVFDGSRTYFKSSATNRNGIAFACKFFEYVKTYVGGMCNNRRFYKGNAAVINSIKTYEFCIYGSPYVYAGFCSSTATTIEEFTAEMESNPATILAILDNPIETPLSATELAAYRALHTNNQVTTIFNDANANMKVKYRKER